MVLGHYIKRVLETLFVHRFSNDTMPFKNLLWNCSGYWVMFGIFVMYFFLQPTNEDYKSKDIAMSILFTIFELLNLKTHLILRGLRQEGTTMRGIPCGWGFNQVSCANYWWEFCCWLSFAIYAETWGALVFLVISFMQMFVWA